jgi:hypothetical protein
MRGWSLNQAAGEAKRKITMTQQMTSYCQTPRS